MKLLLASGNKKKIAELERMLTPLRVDLLTPADIGGLPEVEEDRPTFAGNAAKKALAAAAHSGHWALADDSGLCVDALDGAPGVFSARFANPEAPDDAANNEKLLRLLAGKPESERGAHFICALALADPQGTLIAEIEGKAQGRILDGPRGDGDFGYDPLFLFTEPGFPETGRGFAELTLAEKSAVSHRGRALRELEQRLPQLLG